MTTRKQFLFSLKIDFMVYRIYFILNCQGEAFSRTFCHDFVEHT